MYTMGFDKTQEIIQAQSKQENREGIYYIISLYRGHNICEWEIITYHEVTCIFPCFILVLNTHLLNTALISAIRY